jgi:hypothetical protein
MAFEATLTIEDKTFRVFSFNYKASRDYERFGRPTSSLYGNKMEFIVEHSPDCILLHLWAYSNHEMKNGKITFMQRNSLQKQTEIRFTEGFIVSIQTSFNSEGEVPMTESFSICARSFEYESQGNLASYDMDWPA